ncbi:uncharacterized protein LOC135834549 [Planococcus citri]|uniref:uncharacterized protein LOC135834549 n=1 Tax=Planococcus citri TaxID=170843 RepID=UPI0031F94FEC
MADHNDIILKIINCVKQYPALYDTAHEDYNRYYKKIQIWNAIASEVNYSDGKSAQTKWRNIRDSYVKHLKSLQSAEPAYKKYRNWQWVEQMSFLKKFLGGNKHKNSSKTVDNPETSLIEVVESVYGETSSFNETESPDEGTPRKRKLTEDVWFNAEQVQECDTYYPKDYVVENATVDPNLDATDLLFLSYAKTLKNLSQRRQIQVKMKISELMGLAELDELNDKGAEFKVDSSESTSPSTCRYDKMSIANVRIDLSQDINEADSSGKEKSRRTKS